MRLMHRILPIAATLLAACAVAPPPAVATNVAVVEVLKTRVATVPVAQIAAEGMQLQTVDVVLAKEYIDTVPQFVTLRLRSVPTLIDAIHTRTLRPGRAHIDVRQRRDRMLALES